MNIEIISTDTGTYDAIIKSIQVMGHEARVSICLNKSNLQDVVQRKPDLVILSKKNIFIENEENICLSEYFETNNINFSGSSKEALKYDSDKALTKSYLKEQGHNTANYFTATPGEYINDNKIPIRYPLFIKPNSSAYGNGIDDLSYVTNYLQFESKVLSLYTTYNEPVLVEEYLESQEFTVALIKTKKVIYW
ncbi:hypothetical protein [Candidatus Sulfurimonas baltica]|uniref:ATP-grasp domain-containing protein n=1 Tax=Candidatus Sulfurimonas baltica TaxID=2740404 RepID=A0A7S7LU73_9BACT|nr:hypothetical protein [Candidatus Sulfurimonas baltica]QOY50883.1 hypothetical protein HUE88_06940 [Candidatus Sulfurimonas baltica]